MTYHSSLPEDLKRDWGIVTIAQDFLPDDVRRDYTKSDRVMLALDAQPTLVTQPNAAIPFMATTYVDPETIRILQTPNKGAEIIGEKKLGDWNTTTVMFERVENTGRVVAYGDYNDDGNTNVNIDFPQRQAFKFQTIVEYGDDAAERASLAKLNFIAEMKNSAVIVMEKFRDLSYHFGIAGLQLYGILNDPGPFRRDHPVHQGGRRHEVGEQRDRCGLAQRNHGRHPGARRDAYHAGARLYRQRWPVHARWPANSRAGDDGNQLRSASRRWRW